jgi:alpha-glucosidase (family GH31 glycosyl hydrolase)
MGIAMIVLISSSEGGSSFPYLPQGKWIDYEKGTVYEGNQTISYPVDKNTWLDIPMFLKEGAIVATQDVMNYIGEIPVDKVYMDIFPSVNKTDFNFYDDDGHSYDYENGTYYKQIISQ